MTNHIDLFSGIGGFSIASNWAGFETVQFVEKDKFCQKVLKKHWPNVTIHSDIKDFNFSGKVDLLTGSTPCQPFSVAGKRKGVDDDRYLWPEMFRIIRECNPTWSILENVSGIIPFIDDILDDLEGENYTAWPLLIPASAIGSPHKRERLWVIAHRHGERCNVRLRDREERHIQNDIKRYIETVQSVWSQFVPESWQTYEAEKWMQINAEISRNYDGIPDRVDRIKSLGNSIVPQAIYPILKIIHQIEQGKL